MSCRGGETVRNFWGVFSGFLNPTANAMVSSRLDYSNSLIFWVSKESVAERQNVENVLCHIVFRLDGMSHVAPYLEKSMVTTAIC